MAIVKEVRIRPVNANIDERLGTTTQKPATSGLFSGLKGGLSDVKVIVEDDGNKWIGTFLPIADANAAFEQTFKKKDFSYYVAENIVSEMMKIGATKKLSVSKDTKTKPENYYEVVQDPYQDNPPKRRSFGNDPYYLNNGAKISIFWMIGDKFSVPKGPEFREGIYLVDADWGTWIGGTIWSDDQGNELPGTPARDKDGEIIPDTWIGKMTNGTWLNPSKSGELENYSIDEIKKYVLVESPSLSSQQPEKFTITAENIVDFKSTTDDPKKINQWAIPLNFINRDKSIISAIIDVWNKKVPEYGKPANPNKVLSLCNPDFYPTVEMKYISPIGALVTAGLTPSQTQESEEKFQLNVKLPEVLDIKAGVDMPLFSVYVGDIPEIDPDNIFTDEIEEFLQEDDEFSEAKFEGTSESVLEIQEYKTPEIQKATEENAQLVNDLPVVTGSHKLDLIPQKLYGNGKIEINCCNIHGKPVNVKIAPSVLDLIADAAKAGHTVKVNSGFRPAFGTGLRTKSQSGVLITSQSQEELYNQNCKGGKCFPATAKPGSSRHGNGIAIDFNTGSRTGAISPLNPEIYKWMVKNSWKYGFIRAEDSEEWHYEYWPDKAKNGPYALVKPTGKNNNLFYADLGLNNLTI